jgi:hypothetical protein
MSQACGDCAESHSMRPDTVIHIPVRLQALAATAVLLERLDRQPRGASAGQYRALVRQLDHLLDGVEDDPSLTTLLEGLPALAELHENRHYAEAGLCRSPLAEATEAELQSRELLRRVGCNG